ncbi:hypothetical protein [Planctomyces sp. SH-PL62]|uniref:hypothetical protein n=1 Tax=Planctomyces sp. SH-PL62 TaxID=1636152 RepID=UPI00078BBC83|nr:hypothetical protein [Planctomyces sp. SH-PL62]AMV41054.1 hypothetical protein VT85_26700 [Planctomyces sp. SH-PL62]
MVDSERIARKTKGRLTRGHEVLAESVEVDMGGTERRLEATFHIPNDVIQKGDGVVLWPHDKPGLTFPMVVVDTIESLGSSVDVVIAHVDLESP